MSVRERPPLRDEQDEIQYHAARKCWRVRDQLTPSGEYTWAYWFKARFGRTLEEAAKDFGGRR